LSAAATIAAGLGQMSGGNIDLTAVSAGELDPVTRNNHHLIVIGKPDDNALFNDLELPLPIDNTRLEPGQGVLEEIISPWNEFRLILVVSGLDDAGVSNASHALNRQTHFLGMRGPTAIVTQLRPLSQSVTPRTSSMTLATLGYEDEIAYGAQPRNFTFDFSLPLGWQLEDFPFFVLKFYHADILDPNESIIDIKLNGVPIGSTLLDKSNATEGELTVSLLRHSLKTGRNRLEVGVEMNFAASTHDRCAGLGDERAWTVISSESEIFLPYNAIDLPPDLRLLPYPFVQNSSPNQTFFVLPDDASSSILNHLIQLAILLGSPSQAEYISAHVAYVSEVDQDMRANYHLILLGRPLENTLLRTINDYLPHPFALDSDTLKPLVIDSVAFLPDPDRDAGLLEIIESPWSERHSLLAVTGTTDKGVQLAVQTLLEPSSSLEGNLAVVEPFLFSDQVSIFVTDTRGHITANEETSTNNTTSEDNLLFLAERWWK